MANYLSSTMSHIKCAASVTIKIYQKVDQDLMLKIYCLKLWRQALFTLISAQNLIHYH